MFGKLVKKLAAGPSPMKKPTAKAIKALVAAPASSSKDLLALVKRKSGPSVADIKSIVAPRRQAIAAAEKKLGFKPSMSLAPRYHQDAGDLFSQRHHGQYRVIDRGGKHELTYYDSMKGKTQVIGSGDKKTLIRKSIAHDASKSARKSGNPY